MGGAPQQAQQAQLGAQPWPLPEAASAPGSARGWRARFGACAQRAQHAKHAQRARRGAPVARAICASLNPRFLSSARSRAVSSSSFMFLSQQSTRCSSASCGGGGGAAAVFSALSPSPAPAPCPPSRSSAPALLPPAPAPAPCPPSGAALQRSRPPAAHPRPRPPARRTRGRWRCTRGSPAQSGRLQTPGGAGRGGAGKVRGGREGDASRVSRVLAGASLG